MKPIELTNISVTKGSPEPGASTGDPDTSSGPVAESKGSGTEIPPDHSKTAPAQAASTGSGTEIPPDH